tara:strand:- start:195 stop:1073 length:879 start_codon:yes stop_codon:yes gene_type:complete
LKKSQRHHYLPVFYITGFTGEDGKISVFNKFKGEIDKLRKSPKQIFFEWNRNSFNINGHETDFLEKVYQFGETKFAETYRKLIDKFEPITVTAYDILHLTLFISEINWRIPVRDKVFNEYINSYDYRNAPIKLIDKETGEHKSIEELKPLTKEPAFKESMRHVMAIEDYLKNTKKIKIENWLIYYKPIEAPQLRILCDNPIILREETENILESELIFPLSNGKIVYHTKGKRLKEIPAMNNISIDTLLFIQANQYVCCSDTSYLNSIRELSKLYNTPERINILRNEIFQVFE